MSSTPEGLWPSEEAFSFAPFPDTSDTTLWLLPGATVPRCQVIGIEACHGSVEVHNTSFRNASEAQRLSLKETFALTLAAAGGTLEEVDAYIGESALLSAFVKLGVSRGGRKAPRAVAAAFDHNIFTVKNKPEPPIPASELMDLAEQVMGSETLREQSVALGKAPRYLERKLNYLYKASEIRSAAELVFLARAMQLAA